MHVTPIAPLPLGPPFYDPWRSVLFAACVGVPILGSVYLQRYGLLLFASIGAFMALMVDPRRDVGMRVIAILIAIAAIGLAASLGVAFAGHRAATFAAALALAFLAGLPRPTLPYFTLVGKLAVTCVVAGATGLVAAREAAWAFAAGALVSLAGTVIDAWLRGSAQGASDPRHEAADLAAGKTNGLFYAATFAATVAVALAGAEAVSAKQPAWVALTVLFVMHPNDAQAWQLIRERVGGTLAGVALAAIVVWIARVPIVLAFIAIAAAAAVPWAMSRRPFYAAMATTVFVIVVLDVALENLGADVDFLLARFYDTLLGCAFAGITLLLLRIVRHWRGRGRTRNTTEASEAPESPHDIGHATPPVDPGGHP
jgi:Fusaric acid resistance protein-like